MSTLLGCLWFLPIAFMFYCQHHVCEEYFIPAINCLVSKANASDKWYVQRWGEGAVAGATIMALGCNGPELFCNLISLYIGSDAGIGVVIGSEIFNLLIIIGCSVLFCPTMPLVLERASFVRDCSFYALSIGLLVWALTIRSPNEIDITEACVLLAAEVLFVLAVYFTSDIMNMCSKKKPELEQPLVNAVKKPQETTAHIHGVAAKVTVLPAGRMGFKGMQAENMTLDPINAGIMIKEAEATAPSSTPAAEVTNYRGSVGFNVGDEMMEYKSLREVRVVENSSFFYMDFAHNALDGITLKVEAKEDEGGIDRPSQTAMEQRTKLLELIASCSLGRKPKTSASSSGFDMPEEQAGKVYFHVYNAGLCGEGGAFSHFTHAMKKNSWDMKILAVVELLADLMLKPTLGCVDVKDTTKENRWPACFMGAMGWLAVYSFLMLEVATQINIQIPALSMAFLGVTVCAIGTSFPNAIASILMSKQDKSAAAIANALGSNVQNVFLAMAMPWAIFMATPTSWSHFLCVEPREQWTPVPQAPAESGQSTAEGVQWMLGTLVLVFCLALLPTAWTFSQSYGYFLCFVYVVYLIWTSLEALAPGIWS